MYYALKQKKNGKFITGTDFNNKPRQLFNSFYPPRLFGEDEIPGELKRRKISLKHYKAVPVIVSEVATIDLLCNTCQRDINGCNAQGCILRNSHIRLQTIYKRYLCEYYVKRVEL